jgi:2-polyprenyl-3-methyl-5-hydroxy-6-metoxy-1,4-benzoquinol methylase
LQLALDRYLPQDGSGLRVLDVGCGTGYHLADLRRRGFAVAGIDGSEAMLSEASRRGADARLGAADVEAIPFRSGAFDYVLCVEVLRYLPQALPCLREIARVLRPGGVCLLTATPLLNLNGYALVNRLTSAVPVPGFTRLRQYFARSAELRREMIAAGFCPPDIHGVYFGPVNWLERLAPRVVPAALRRWEQTDAALADRPLLREFSNMFLVHARRDATGG